MGDRESRGLTALLVELCVDSRGNAHHRHRCLSTEKSRTRVFNIPSAVVRAKLPGLKSAAVCDKAVAFQEAYESVHKIIRTTEAEGYSDYLRTAATAMVAAEVVTPPTALDEIDDIGERLHHSYLQAYAMKYKGLVPLLDKVSASLGVPVTVAEIKGMWRAVEKAILRPTGGVPWDLVRAQFVCGSMRQVCDVLEALSRDPAIAVVQVTDTGKRIDSEVHKN